MHLRICLFTFIFLLCSFYPVVSYNNDGSCDSAPSSTEQSFPTPVPYRIIDVDKSLCHQLLMYAPSSVKKVIYNLIYPPKNVRAVPKKLLLVGPPGCGKSSMAQAIAYGTGRHPSVDGSAIL